MKTKKLFVLLISLSVLLFMLVINIVNGQVGSDSSGVSSSGNSAILSSIPDISAQKIVLSPEFNGTWAGIIASYPASDDKNSEKSETCIKCDALPQCESNQILIQRTCTRCAYCVDKSSKDVANIITDFVGDILTGFGSIFSNLGSNLTDSSSSSGGSSSGGVSSSSGSVSSSSSGLSATSSSSSGGFLFSIGSSSSGSNPSDSSLGNAGGPSAITKQSNTIGEVVSLNLFTKEGKLNGSIQIGNLLSDGYIVSQNAVSPDEVQITVKNKAGRAVLLKLKLFGKPSFVGIFLDGISIEGRYLTPFYSYLVPSGGKALNLQPQTKSTPGTYKPTKSGRPGGTGRAGGESGGRAGGESGGRPGGDESGRAGGDIYSRPGGDDGGRSGGQGNNRPGGDDEDDSM